MMLSDVRDYIASLQLADHVYMGKLPDKREQSIGVYNSKHEHAYKTAIGGPALKSYEAKYVTLLIHWNKLLRDTEKVSYDLFNRLLEANEVTINDAKIKFIQPLYEIQDIGTDDNGIYEMVIEVAFIFEKGKGELYGRTNRSIPML